MTRPSSITRFEQRRIKQLFRIVTGSTPKSDVHRYWDGDVPWVTPEDLSHVDGKDLHVTSRSITEAGLMSCATSLSPVGSLVLSTRAPIGYVASVHVDFAINQGCRALVAREGVLPSYYRYLLSSRRKELQSLGRGSTFQELGTQDLGALLVPLPSEGDQREIVRFLDEETAKVDALIERKRKLLAVLDEQRLSHLMRVLGHGLPESGRAATGLDWLPLAPKHWEAAPLYARYEVKLGKMLDQKRVTGAQLGPYLRNINIQWDHVQIDDLPEMDFAPDERKRLRLKPGDLLVCEGGEVGRTAMWRGEIEECFFQKAVHRLRPLTGRDLPRYFLYVMLAAAKAGFFRAGGNPNTIDHLTGDQLRRYRFPFPAREEQKRIADALDAHEEHIRRAKRNVVAAIDAQNEYRSALITAAVTGQIDVGSAA